VKIGIQISGRGSNMQALVAACAQADFPAEVVLVISNDPSAAGLDWAAAQGIPTAALSHKGMDREAHERLMDAALVDAGVELVCNAGYMRVLTPWFVEKWRDRLINIHPSLLPSFPGLNTHARALTEGVRWHGCTVHYVRAPVDEGPIIAQAAVPVAAEDTPDTLSARVLKAEHELYPVALRLVASGNAPVVDERVTLADAPLPDSMCHPGEG
jgi:phosphoribosylglycinamide formyltransferase-1